MKNCVDLVLAKSSLDQFAFADVPAHDFYAVQSSGANQLTLWHPVPDQAYHVGPRFHESPCQPTSHQSRGASDQHGAIPPYSTTIHAHTFQGASPVFQRSFRS